MEKRSCHLFWILIFFISSMPAQAADVRVPELELQSWGRMEDGSFRLNSRGYVSIEVVGAEEGYGGQVEFLFEDTALEERRIIPQQAVENVLTVKSFSVELKRIFQLPINLSYFHGITDQIGSGNIFTDLFETEHIASVVQGFVYFPQGVVYEGIHTIGGTGIKLYTEELFEQLFIAAYTYQDLYLGKGKFSSDVWVAFNSPTLKLETFIGASYPVSSYGIYRAGLLFHYLTPDGGEFFTQIGVPRWDPKVDREFTIDLFYFLFEPRVHIGLFGVSLTFFRRPEFYNQMPTNEKGITDLFLRFTYGDLAKTSWVAGIESGLTLQTAAGDQITYRLTPLFHLLTRGVQWEARINLNLFPFNWNSLIEAFLGAKTSF